MEVTKKICRSFESPLLFSISVGFLIEFYYQFSTKRFKEFI